MTTVAELRAALSEMADDTELYVHIGTAGGHATVPFSLAHSGNYGPRAALIHCGVKGLTKWGEPCPVMVSLMEAEQQETG